MSIVDINSRIVDDLELFRNNCNSADSYILVQNGVHIDNGLSTIDLSLGERCFYYKDFKYYKIDNELVIKPQQALLLETFQNLALPNNVFGIVTGKGSLIFQGLFVSTGKIDPGFCGKLKISIFNASTKNIKIQKKDFICSCAFMNIETHYEVPFRNINKENVPVSNLENLSLRVTNFFKANSNLISIIISLISLIFAITIGVLNYNKK